MYDAKFWSDLIGTLVWPVIVVFLIFLFKDQIKELLKRVTKVKVGQIEVELGDKVTYYSPIDNTTRTIKIEPTAEEQPPKGKVEIQMLSPEEIEASRKRAQARLDEDIKKVGTSRGELFQLPNGRYGIAWKAEVTVSVGIK